MSRESDRSADDSGGKPRVCPHCRQQSIRGERCSVCGVQLGWKPSGFVVTAVCALLLFTLGFSLYSRSRTARLIRIEDLSARYNFSEVRIKGVLLRDALHLKSGAVLLQVDDGSGVLSVFVEEADAVQMRKGAVVEVTGVASVGVGSNRRLTALSASDLNILNAASQEKDAVHPALIGDPAEPVCLTGRVVRVMLPSPESRAPCRMVIEDASGRVEVVYWLDLPEEYLPGRLVVVTGRVNRYRGESRLKVSDSDGIQPIQPSEER